VALGAGELLDEVLVDATENVARLLGALPEPDHRLDERAHQLTGQRRPGVDARQDVAKPRVLVLDQLQRVIDPSGDVGLGGGGKERAPASLLGYPEDVRRAVLVAVLKGLGALGGVLYELAALVLGRLHAAAELVGCLEEGGSVRAVTFRHGETATRFGRRNDRRGARGLSRGRLTALRHPTEGISSASSGFRLDKRHAPGGNRTSARGLGNRAAL
jgi:hypothetical protein